MIAMIDNKQEQEIPATTRVKMAAVLTKFGTRAQKRAVAAGQSVKMGALWVGKGVATQITAPYSITKMVLVGVLGWALLALMIYVVLYLCVIWMIITGSAIVGLVLGLLTGMAIVGPFSGLIGKLMADYLDNANEYWNNQNPLRVVKVRHQPAHPQAYQATWIR